MFAIFFTTEGPMLEIAEFIPPKPHPLRRVARQVGMDLAVGGLPFDMLQAGERVCSRDLHQTAHAEGRA